jgi:hypothetical protein
MGSPPDQPDSAVHQIAFSALGHGYAIGYVVCCAAALFAAVLRVATMRGGGSDTLIRREALVDEPARN